MGGGCSARFEGGGDHVPPNSWVCGTHGLTHRLVLPTWMGCHRLGDFKQWVPKSSGGEVW